MKKLLSAIIALVLAMSFFTGCVDEPNSEGTVEPTPTPVATPDASPVEDEEDPNYPTVLAMWEDMNGYWVNADGEYMFYSLDENGKAEMRLYDKDGKLINYMKATAVMSSNKTSYYMAMDIPALSNDEVKQSAGTAGYFIELEGYGDDYVKIAKETSGDQVYKIYVKVGDNLEKLADAVKQAAKLEK